MILALAIPGLAFGATESPCLKAYQAANADYLTEMTGLSRQKNEVLAGGVGGSFAVAGLCYAKTHSVLACAILSGPVAVVSFGFGRRVGERLRQLDESHKIYSAYVAMADAPSVKSDLVFSELGVQSAQEALVRAEMLHLMESGELCRGNRPAKTWAEVSELLKVAMFRP